VVTRGKWLGALGLAATLLLLNASLTFESAWPTPGIRWRGALSIELGALVLAMAAAGRRLPASPGIVRWLAGTWMILVLGHYATVSASALYGREINLFWDLRFVPDVIALLARPERLWVVGVAVAAAVLIAVLAFWLVSRGMRRLRDAARDEGERRVVGGLSAIVVSVWIVAAAGIHLPGTPSFSPAVTPVYARQLRLMAATLRGSIQLAPSPPMSSDLSLLKGADVLLFFIEAYGAVTYDRPEFAARLSADRVRFETAVRDTNRQVVSAFVESPTFGGSSWLAHVSLLSGVEIRTHDANAVLMSQDRDTMVTLFKRRGYRTVALMPGTWQEWPEGRFYGFDVVYGGESLAYKGPPFGWWDMTDQFALARLDDLEVSRTPRPPLFVFFPTISTHIPFTPTPPYQADWRRMLTPTPYEEADLERVYERQPDWLDLGPSYADAVSYVYQSLTGYVRMHADHDVVMLLVGDHQPAAAVSGESASWDVPVHVIASRPQLLERLRQAGFRSGLTPARPGLGPMHRLTPALLAAFGPPGGAEDAETANKYR
jgi:hypothetical protein